MISSHEGIDERPLRLPRAERGASSSAAGSSTGWGVDVGGLLVGLLHLRQGLVDRGSAVGRDPVGVGGVGGRVTDQLDGVVAEGQLVLVRHRGQAASLGRGTGTGLAELAGQQPGLVVLRDDVAAGQVVGELGAAGATVHGVLGDQGPAAVGLAPGVPGDVLVVQRVVGEEHPGRLAQRAGRAAALGRPAAQGGLLRGLRHVGALGEDRGGEAHDRLDGGPGGGGDVLGGLAGADARLDVAGPQGAFHLHLLTPSRW